MSKGTQGKKWLVEIRRTETCLVEVEADDWCDAQSKGYELAGGLQDMLQFNTSPVRRQHTVEVHANLDGKFRAYMYDLHGPGDVLLVEAPSGGGFSEGGKERVTKMATAAGVKVKDTWNGGVGGESMSLKVNERPDKKALEAFNKALQDEPVHFRRAGQARENHRLG